MGPLKTDFNSSLLSAEPLLQLNLKTVSQTSSLKTQQGRLSSFKSNSAAPRTHHLLLGGRAGTPTPAPRGKAGSTPIPSQQQTNFGHTTTCPKMPAFQLQQPRGCLCLSVPGQRCPESIDSASPPVSHPPCTWALFPTNEFAF